MYHVGSNTCERGFQQVVHDSAGQVCAERTRWGAHKPLAVLSAVVKFQPQGAVCLMVAQPEACEDVRWQRLQL